MTYLFSQWQNGEKPPKGWDCASAVEDGWGQAELEAFMKATVRPWTPPSEKSPEKPDDEHSPPAWLTEAPPPDLDAYGTGMTADRPIAPAGHADRDAVAQHADDTSPPAFKRHQVEDAIVRDGLKMARDASGKPILDPRDPMPSARALLVDRFTDGGLRSVHHYRGTFWRWDGACYRDADTDSTQAQIWNYLDNARRYGKEGEIIPFQPNRGEVENVSGIFWCDVSDESMSRSLGLEAR